MRILLSLLLAVVGSSCVVDITGAPCLTTQDCPLGQVCVASANAGRCEVPDGSAGGSAAGGGTSGGGTGGGVAGGDDGGGANLGGGIGTDDAGVDAGRVDAGIDGGVDAGGLDAGFDAGLLDAGLLDAGLFDAGMFDAGPTPCDGGCGAFAPACECLLTELRPSIANTNDVITLEGRFGASTLVTFPGGATATPTLLSPTRVSVTVPATATAGSLLVSTQGMTLPPMPFRRASFALGVGRFDPHYEQASYSRPMPELISTRSSHTATVIGPWVYVIGGSTIERALVNADGTLGQFSVYLGSALVTPRSEHTTHRVGSTLYVIGGTSTSGGLQPGTVERATISADGTLGPFSVVPGVFQRVPRARHTSVIIGDGLYVIGGNNLTSSALPNVERATLSSDGISDFSLVAGVTLQTARHGHGMAVVGDTVYAVGGAADTSATGLATIEQATITQGQLGTFTTTSTNLNVGRQGPSVVVLGNRLFVFGGRHLGNALSSTESAPLTGGVLGALTLDRVSSLNLGRGSMATVISGNSIHAIGGMATASLTSVERASINSSGAIGAPVLEGPAFPVGRGGTQPVVVGNTIYFMGGSTPNNTVVQTTVLPDGTLTPFVTSGSTLLTGRFAARSAVFGDSIYTVAGVGTANATLTTIERAQVLPDAGLGPFVPAGSINARRGWPSMVALGNTLNLFGGYDYNGGGYLQTWERGTVSSNGSVNFPPTDAGLPTLQAKRWYAVTVVGRNGVYLIGGHYPGYLTTIERANYDASGNITSTQAAGISLSVTRGDAQAAVIGDSVYVLGGYSAAPTDPSNTIERGFFVSADGGVGVLTSFTQLSSPQMAVTAASAGNASIVIDNRLYYFYGTSTYSYPLQ